MKNSKFIIYNHTIHFKDFELFAHITNVMSKGLLSNNETQYCYASSYNYEKCVISIEFMKKKNYYRIDIFENSKGE